MSNDDCNCTNPGELCADCLYYATEWGWSAMTDYRVLVREGLELHVRDGEYCAECLTEFPCEARVLLDAVESLTAELNAARECAGDWKTVADARERRERTALLTMGIEPTGVRDVDLVESVKRLRAERDAARAELDEVQRKAAGL